ncbi:hypothetical protein [Thalassospira sp. TSL5-1]|uniref:hypothetical protein n=1 Tax=Thalassospira sp. TSL5-1 TaxID=1544451 RepID=UPI00093BBA54|nr:hypothetical protein [Thalassospira sp. TSL5-1]OKH87848.1 hypothetical protein LF95_14085 [Thalassospira sp. TSL5-1]
MEEETELYLPDDDCTAGGSCPGEGVFVPQQIGNTALDADFVGSDADIQCDLGLANIDRYPLTDELFPLIYDGAPMTLDGVMDCFARKYPERAQLLCALIEKEGYQVEWHEFPDREVDALRRKLREMRPADWGANTPMYSARQREERSRLYEKISQLKHWRIENNKIIILSRIDRNIDETTYFGDDESLLNYFPTSEEGADWLNAVMGDWMVRSGIPGASADEEFKDNWRSRVVWGGLNVVFGAADIVGGVVLVAGSTVGTAVTGGTSAVGIVAGGTMTLAGFEAITQGIDMWRTPDEVSHGSGWLGDGAFAMMNAFGVLEDDDVAAFNRYWAFTMLGLTLGGAGVIGFAGDAIQVGRAGRTATLDFVSEVPYPGLASAKMAIVGVKNARFGQFVAHYASLPSGRIVFNFQGLGHAVAPHWESLTRLRLRLFTSNRSFIQERAAKLGAGEAGLIALRGGVSSLEDAQNLVYQVAAHMGMSRRMTDEIISEITLGSAGQLSAFNARLNLRVSGDIGMARYLRRAAIGDYNEFIAMNEIFHELTHAQRLQKWVQSGRHADDYWKRVKPHSLGYDKEEFIVETTAQKWTRKIVEPRIAQELQYGNMEEAHRLKELLDEALEDSGEYIKHYKRRLGQ